MTNPSTVGLFEDRAAELAAQIDLRLLIAGWSYTPRSRVVALLALQCAREHRNLPLDTDATVQAAFAILVPAADR